MLGPKVWLLVCLAPLMAACLAVGVTLLACVILAGRYDNAEG